MDLETKRGVHINKQVFADIELVARWFRDTHPAPPDVMQAQARLRAGWWNESTDEPAAEEEHPVKCLCDDCVRVARYNGKTQLFYRDGSIITDGGERPEFRAYLDASAEQELDAND